MSKNSNTNAITLADCRKFVQKLKKFPVPERKPTDGLRGLISDDDSRAFHRSMLENIFGGMTITAPKLEPGRSFSITNNSPYPIKIQG